MHPIVARKSIRKINKQSTEVPPGE